MAIEIIKTYDDINFEDLSINCTSLDTMYIINSQLIFIDEDTTFTLGAGNKCDIKNDRNHISGGSSAAALIDYVINYEIFRKSSVSCELALPKEFTSDKKVEDIFSHKTINLCYSDLEEGTELNTAGNASSLLTVLV